MATTFTRSDDLQGAEFVEADLRGARFIGADLSGVVMRGVEVREADIDAPWLSNGESFLRVNGVDVIPLVEAELNRRFPGRADRRAEDPDGLRAAWAALERTWTGTLERVAAMPAGTVDVSVGGEWSFAQTLRHLVLATDTWLGRGILEIEQPFHPVGLAGPGAEEDGLDMSVFTTVTPSYGEVLEARAGRVAMVRNFLAAVTADELAATRRNPWNPEYQETTVSCLHVILEEEWEHHRYAVRDLDAIEDGQPSSLSSRETQGERADMPPGAVRRPAPEPGDPKSADPAGTCPGGRRTPRRTAWRGDRRWRIRLLSRRRPGRRCCAGSSSPRGRAE